MFNWDDMERVFICLCHPETNKLGRTHCKSGHYIRVHNNILPRNQITWEIIKTKFHANNMKKEDSLSWTVDGSLSFILWRNKRSHSQRIIQNILTYDSSFLCLAPYLCNLLCRSFLSKSLLFPIPLPSHPCSDWPTPDTLQGAPLEGSMVKEHITLAEFSWCQVLKMLVDLTKKRPSNQLQWWDLHAHHQAMLDLFKMTYCTLTQCIKAKQNTRSVKIWPQ
jgi:hypothetical protein